MIFIQLCIGLIALFLVIVATNLHEIHQFIVSQGRLNDLVRHRILDDPEIFDLEKDYERDLLPKIVYFLDTEEVHARRVKDQRDPIIILPHTTDIFH